MRKIDFESLLPWHAQYAHSRSQLQAYIECKWIGKNDIGVTVSENENIENEKEEKKSGEEPNQNFEEQNAAHQNEIPKETCVSNSMTGGNQSILKDYPDPLIKYHLKFQKADDCRDDLHVLESGAHFANAGPSLWLQQHN